ncbi:MAG TPA: thiamine phosphate synthase [Propionibacteriaceae bacterium]|nr:thiamine phosphate synthase [Propionibacteriaceae bacterium]
MTALMGLDARLRLAKLYLITDARTKQGDLTDFLQAAFAGGVDIVQIREKAMSREAELEVLELARTTAVLRQKIVCVNDSAALAGEFHADMLHLGQADGPSAPARKQLHRWALLGRSTHSSAEVDAALADQDVDYLTVGPVYATSLNPAYPPVGLDPVRHAARAAPASVITSKPFFAVGGIGLDTIDAVIEAGARRVAVVSAITMASDPQEVAQQLRRRLQDAWDADPATERYIMQALAGAGSTR